jgi:hypothetical protein
LPLPLLHIALCLWAQLIPSEGSWGWFFIFALDFPFSVLLLRATDVAPPLLVFGILGTLWWLLINGAGVWIVAALSRPSVVSDRAVPSNNKMQLTRSGHHDGGPRS